MSKTDTITVQMTPEAAKRYLSEIVRQFADLSRKREELTAELVRLDEIAINLRQQLQGKTSTGGRTRKGKNLERIRDYLKSIPDNKGIRMTEISKATGISASSTNFTLNHHSKDFVQDEETKLWRLRI